MRDEAFEALYERHAQDLFGFLAYRTGDRVLAEDLVADTFERAYKARRRFDPRRASEKTWLYAIALNALRDHLRKAHRQDVAFDLPSVEPGGDPLGATIDRLDVMAALTLLSPEEREALALRFGGDLTLKEVATVIGESVTTTEGRVYRALRKLRASLPARVE